MFSVRISLSSDSATAEASQRNWRAAGLHGNCGPWLLKGFSTTETLGWLMQDYGPDEVAASHVMGHEVRYDIANVFNHAYSVVCRIGRKWLTDLRCLT